MVSEEESNALSILDPDNIDAHNNIGLILAKWGQINEALDEYKKVLEIDPNYSNVYFNLGLAYRQMGMTKSAIQSMEKFLALEGLSESSLVKQAKSILASLKRQGSY